ncbi:hypothetical protein [Nocardioides humi]|uniref:ABC-2 type transport system permease protein n=1 Tax=Nocardioides humi TaxID=449461 RepID=A0ABN1ZW16_9ACTN|nr:hypothetical protein [Nocardioides humi]
MRRYAGSAVPWGTVALVAAVVVGLMELVARHPVTMWILEPASVGLLAAAAACCFDERAGAVVDPAPRSLAWRTLARTSGLVPLAAAWTWAVVRGWDSLFGRPWEVATQGYVALLLGATWSVVLRGLGTPSPGARIAPAVVPLAVCWPVAGWLQRRVPVFPHSPSDAFGDWDLSHAGWQAAGLVAVVLLVLSLAEARWWMIRRTR